LRTIVENAGLEGSVVVAKLLKVQVILDKTDEYVDMLAAGIIDPKKSYSCSIRKRSLVAGMILTTECALIDIKEDNGGGHPMGGGMPGMM
jgi:chaperonin GroEL